MQIAKLSIRYDRGIAHNAPADIGLESAPASTASGQDVRGLGTHWRSAEARDKAKACELEDRRIKREFRKAFPVGPFDGTFYVPRPGAAAKFLATLEPKADIDVRITEFDVTVDVGAFNDNDLKEWGVRVQRQIIEIPLGRGKEAEEDGLKVLSQLISCPVLTEETRERLEELVSMAKSGRLERLEFARQLKITPVSVEESAIAVQPRRVAPVSY